MPRPHPAASAREGFGPAPPAGLLLTCRSPLDPRRGPATPPRLSSSGSEESDLLCAATRSPPGRRQHGAIRPLPPAPDRWASSVSSSQVSRALGGRYAGAGGGSATARAHPSSTLLG